MDCQSKLEAYVGTYTTGESKGIYRFTLNFKTGAIENIKLVAEVENPTYLALSKDNKYLYSVSKMKDEGGVASFSIDHVSGDLKLINYQVEQGAPPCHVTLHPENTFLFAANYHNGVTQVYPVLENGSLLNCSSTAIHEGSGPNKERQEKPHAHFAGLTPDHQHLCAVDLGADEMIVYEFDQGTLSKSNDLSLTLKPGCGPRHLAFHPNGKFAYINTELSGEVIVLSYSPSDSNFKDLQSISTLPDDFQGENLGSAVHITPNGRYLYAGNRGHDSIAAFSIDESSGKLSFVSHTSTQGMHPRDFAIDPTGSFIVAANKDSDNIVPFAIDQSTGKLTQISPAVKIPSPVCIKFLNI